MRRCSCNNACRTGSRTASLSRSSTSFFPSCVTFARGCLGLNMSVTNSSDGPLRQQRLNILMLSSEYGDAIRSHRQDRANSYSRARAQEIVFEERHSAQNSRPWQSRYARKSFSFRSRRRAKHETNAGNLPRHHDGKSEARALATVPAQNQSPAGRTLVAPGDSKAIKTKRRYAARFGQLSHATALLFRSIFCN